MASTQMWGWYPEGKKFVKLRLDADGSIHVVGYVDKLEDIGDVLLTALANNDILYWDDAAGKWKNIAHLGVAAAHHAKYTDANARSAMGAKADANPYHHDRTVKYTNGEAVSAVEAAGLALASGKNIAIMRALSADHTCSGLTARLTAGTALTIGQAVYVGGDSKMELTDADAAASMPVMALCAVETMAENATGFFLLQGFFRDDTWDWTPGGLLYASLTPGALTQDISGYTTGDQVQVVGVAITADIIYFNPSYELVEVS